tara:strand:+ start:358 stop:591 length:234 start_codon:yes stop_codon:yes gene_type:complete
MKTFTELREALLELVSFRKKHKGATKRMSSAKKKEVRLRDKKKAQLGIDAGSKYKLKGGKKVKKTSDELKRKVVSRG